MVHARKVSYKGLRVSLKVHVKFHKDICRGSYKHLSKSSYRDSYKISCKGTEKIHVQDNVISQEALKDPF